MDSYSPGSGPEIVDLPGGNPDLIELNSEPVFEPIRGDPRFKHLLRRNGWDA